MSRWTGLFDIQPLYKFNNQNKNALIGLGHVVDAQKSQCSSMSDGESFEGFGENDAPEGSTPSGGINGVAGVSVNGGVDLELIPHIGSTPLA